MAGAGGHAAFGRIAGRLRHKASKISYQVVFWCIVMLFQIVAVDVMLGMPLSRAVTKRLIDRG